MKEESKKIVQCAYCGKDKEILRYQWKRSKTQLFFCDNKCSGSYYKKDYPVQTCKVCGEPKHPNNGICESQFFKQSVNLQKIGFDISKIGTKDIFAEYDIIKEKLEKLYYVEEESILTLMKKFDIPSTRTFDLLFKFFDIKARNFSNACHNSLKHGRLTPGHSNYKYMTGWHTSWEGHEIYYRSSYELEYMKALDEAKISYQGENYVRFEYYDTQMKKMRVALPDFYLPESNTIVEIKSNWTYNPQNMIDKAKAYREAGYNFKLILEHKEVDI